jgi:uncharacterized peroxidase-related enzyme
MRIKIPELHNVKWYLKPFFWWQKRKYGQVLNPALVWASNPKLFLTVASLYGALDSKKSPLSPILRSLITVRISQINWCEFCVDINSATLIKRSQSELKVQALSSWRDSNIYSAAEKAALDYAEKVTYSEQQVDDSCFEELKKHFNEKVIIELTALIAFQNLSSKFNSALDVAPQGFCKITK